jgi:hypothetical protein
MQPPSFPRIDFIGLNGGVPAFAILCSLGVVIVASLLPSVQTSRVPLSGGLKQSSRGVAAGSGIRDFLVVGQVAVAMLLLFGGLLFGRSFAALLSVRPGFSQQAALTMHLTVPRANFPKDQHVAAYYRRLEERIKTVPGVVEAGFINRLPLSGLAQTGGIEFEGKEAAPQVDWRSATPGYFGAMGIPLVRGRGLADEDRADGPPVGVIDTVLAKMVFGDENPVGKRFRRGSIPGQPNDQPWSEIVGVVGHVLNDSLEREGRPQAYWPETQRTQDRAALVVRTAGASFVLCKRGDRADPAGEPGTAVLRRPDDRRLDVAEYADKDADDQPGHAVRIRVDGAGVPGTLWGYRLHNRVARTRVRDPNGPGSERWRSAPRRLPEDGPNGGNGRGDWIHVVLASQPSPAKLPIWYRQPRFSFLDVGSGAADRRGMLAGLGPAWRAAKADPAQTLRAG